MDDDAEWMAKAVEVARRGWGRTHPNPVVGAILVADGRVLAEGHHAKAGGAHAEVVALTAVEREIPANATLYVTLEPCSSTGRTPPCTEAILRRGVKRVVVGALDEDERHCGKGLIDLRREGVEVVSGVLEKECRDLNLIFHHKARTGRPLVAVKIATTIDGRIATAGGVSKWITGESARADVHRWRRYFPAIGVGAGTVVADDPALTARVGKEEVHCPQRIVFDRSGMLASHPRKRIFTDDFASRTVVLTTVERKKDLVESLPGAVRVEALEREEATGGSIRGWLSEEGLEGLYLEGGKAVLSDFFAANAVDYLFAYRAPRLFLDDRAVGPASAGAPASPDEGISLSEVRHETFGEDQLMRGFVEYS